MSGTVGVSGAEQLRIANRPELISVLGSSYAAAPAGSAAATRAAKAASGGKEETGTRGTVAAAGVHA